ncbi:MAG: RIP metalloprotease RseP [Lentisphaerae bacterium]|nr:RIP metalloprotease RseP [Lentisphaerota bacterium]
MDTFLTVTQGVWAGVIVALLFGLAIFIHEFGHFLSAKLLGFRVDAFAIGFGPAMWRRRVGETDYRINVIPFGGYVALPQLDPSGMEAIQGGEGSASEQLPDVSPWKRIVVSVAGPAGNVLLAVVLAWVIWLAPGSVTGVVSTRIGTVDPETPAWVAGLRSGDVIERVGGQRVTTWNDFMVECHLVGNLERGVELTVRAAEGAVRNVSVAVTNLTPDVRGIAGVYWDGKCQIQEVLADSPAQAAGLLVKDVVTTLDGNPVHNSSDFVARMGVAGARPVLLGVMRRGRELTLTVTPALDAAGMSRIGVSVDNAAEAAMWMQYRAPWRQIRSDAMQVIRVLKALIVPKVSGERKRVAGAIGGPVIIMAMMWRVVQESVLSSMGFLRMICINLAIINLLPLPVLDGGHIVFSLWEMITRRKPHPRVISVLVTGFAVLLIGLMVLLVFKDVLHLRRNARQERAAQQP